jgi:hypothetical protein
VIGARKRHGARPPRSSTEGVRASARHFRAAQGHKTVAFPSDFGGSLKVVVPETSTAAYHDLR